MLFQSKFYITIQRTAEGLWQATMRTFAWGHDEPWATSSNTYSDRQQAVQEALAWAAYEGYSFRPPDDLEPCNPRGLPSQDHHHLLAALSS